jgi:hypothetical protein
VAWLSGEVSGKPFMEWRGSTRWVMPAAMIALAATLALGYALRLRSAPEARAWRSAKWISSCWSSARFRLSSPGPLTPRCIP